MALDFNSVLSKLNIEANRYNLRLYCCGDSAYRLELPNGIRIDFNNYKVTVYGDLEHDAEMYPYDIRICEEFKENKDFIISFYVGRTVGAPFGIKYTLGVKSDTKKFFRSIQIIKTNKYSLLNTFAGKSYFDIANTSYGSLSNMGYRAILKNNLKYFDRDIFELTRLICDLADYLPDDNIPPGYNKNSFKFLRERKGYKLYGFDRYFRLDTEDNKSIYFRAHSKCYTKLNVNTHIVHEYLNDSEENFKSIRLIKDKNNEVTQFITLAEDSTFEVVFCLMNNKYYVKLEDMLLSYSDTFDGAIEKMTETLKDVDNVSSFFKKTRRSIYGY